MFARKLPLLQTIWGKRGSTPRWSTLKSSDIYRIRPHWEPNQITPGYGAFDELPHDTWNGSSHQECSLVHLERPTGSTAFLPRRIVRRRIVFHGCAFHAIIKESSFAHYFNALFWTYSVNCCKIFPTSDHILKQTFQTWNCLIGHAESESVLWMTISWQLSDLRLIIKALSPCLEP